jgi:hypothetical protein
MQFLPMRLTQFLRTVLVSVSDPVLSMHGTGWRIWRWYRSGQGQFVFELDDVQNANLPTSITSPLVEQARTSAFQPPPAACDLRSVHHPSSGCGSQEVSKKYNT